jgi:hypothetical protein
LHLGVCVYLACTLFILPPLPPPPGVALFKRRHGAWICPGLMIALFMQDYESSRVLSLAQPLTSKCPEVWLWGVTAWYPGAW